VSSFSLEGRVAVVTGALGLLGRRHSEALAAAGAAVVVTDINPSECVRRADELSASHGRPALGHGADVTVKASIATLRDAVLARFGRVDVLVNDAALNEKVEAPAGGAPVGFEDYPLDLWNSALNVNLTGMFLMTQACIRPMLQQGKKGSIINICSTYGLNGPDQRIYVKDGQRVAFKPVYYTVTKAGVMGFTRYLAAYYAQTEIRVNALTPGGVFNNHEDYFVKNYSAKTILGRMAKKDEMNGALLFLASDASSYMTGNNVVVDGGWTAW